MTYISHARTPEELKAEVVSDLHRRITFLDGQINVVAKSAAEKSRLNCAIIELGAMLSYWAMLEIVRPVRKRKNEDVMTNNEMRVKLKLPELQE